MTGVHVTLLHDALPFRKNRIMMRAAPNPTNWRHTHTHSRTSFHDEGFTKPFTSLDPLQSVAHLQKLDHDVWRSIVICLEVVVVNMYRTQRELVVGQLCQ